MSSFTDLRLCFSRHCGAKDTKKEPGLAAGLLGPKNSKEFDQYFATTGAGAPQLK
jgi:hypothetical protein